MDDLARLLESGLAELGLEAPPERTASLARFARLLARWGERQNLSGHREPEAVARHLLLDAAALWQALPPHASLADLGSGAGLPGIPIALLSPGTRVVLVDSRLRRHHFQRAAIRELGLATVEARLGRIEDLPPTPCEAVVAQAVAPPARVLGWMLPWAAPGGLLVLPGGASAPDPAADAPLPPGLEGAAVLRYVVPLGGPERTLWTARRGAS